MTDLRQRAILEAVAAGTLSPEDAATRLSDLSPPDDEDERADERARPQSSSAPPPPAPASDGPVSEIRVTVALRSVEIVGDPSVREAVAEGPHVAHREGSTLVIESRLDDEMRSSGFKFRPAGGRIRFGSLGSFGGVGSSFASGWEDALPM